MSDNTEVAALRARLEAIVKEAEDVEAQTTAACHRVQAAALEQTATTTCQRVPSLSSLSSSPTAASQLIPTSSSTYKDTVVVGLHLQAAIILNVRQLVNIILDFSTNYAT
jgi:hypothetical protein